MDSLKLALDSYKKIINDDHVIKINYRNLKNNKLSLYLSIRHNSTVNKINKRQTLNIFLTGNKKKDLQSIQIATRIRDEYETAILKGKDPFSFNSDYIYITDYITVYSKKYDNKNSKKNFITLRGHLAKYKPKAVLKDIDRKFVNGFVDYLKNAVEKSASFYFDKFKQILYHAIGEETISDLPFLRQLTIKKIESDQPHLTIDEMKLVKNCKLHNIQCKNGFLFCCYTGLRFSDMIKLKYSDIIDDKIVLRQIKTNTILTQILHPEAISIIEEQRQLNNKKSEYIFNFCYETWYRNIPKICKSAGIERHITGHCSRHSFATLCTSSDINLYLLSNLLGHKSVRHTQRYAKVEEKKKEEAINKLPEL